MAEAPPPNSATNITSIDIETLASHSELYKAILKFHGKNAQRFLTYPVGAPFSKHCFTTVVQCLGNKNKLLETLHIFKIRDLFLISLYLGSDVLLYHIVFDMLAPNNSVSILDMSIETLGVDHFITKGITHYIMMILDTTYTNTLLIFNTSKIRLRKMIKNSKNQRACVTPDRQPHVCLYCNSPITNLHQRDISQRLAPMRCCGMMLHLQCQLKLFSTTKYPKCPACQTIFSDGEIDLDLNLLDSKMTIRYLANYGIHPLPYRYRTHIWHER